MATLALKTIAREVNGRPGSYMQLAKRQRAADLSDKRSIRYRPEDLAVHTPAAADSANPIWRPTFDQFLAACAVDQMEPAEQDRYWAHH